jgi:trehalose 6-phosphate phosphatase
MPLIDWMNQTATPIQASPDSADAPKPAPGGCLAGHALYLDIDGTILDLAPTPEAVEVPVWMVPLLQRLSSRLEGAVAFVSGRTIGAIDQLFRPLTLPAVGVHGGEIRTPDGRIVMDEQLTAELQAAEPLLREAIARIRGVQLENKRSVIALHYRNVPERGREVLKVAELVAGGLGGQFSVLMGKCVVEIRPRHLTKGSAMRRLMEQAPFHGRTPIFAGDDSTDEDAFEVVNGLGGISVRVGEEAPTAARFRLANPDELRGWLLQIAEN